MFHLKFSPLRSEISGELYVKCTEVQSHNMVYSYSNTSFTLFGMISLTNKGGDHALEGNDDDGAETGIYQ